MLLHKLVYFFIGLLIGIIPSQISRLVHIYLKNKKCFLHFFSIDLTGRIGTSRLTAMLSKEIL